MDKIIDLSQHLKKEIDYLPLFKEYRRIKKLVDESSELNELKAEIVKSIGDKQKHDDLLAKYNSHPLVVNLKELENEVSDYLKEVCNIINKK